MEVGVGVLVLVLVLRLQLRLIWRTSKTDSNGDPVHDPILERILGLDGILEPHEVDEATVAMG